MTHAQPCTEPVRTPDLDELLQLVATGDEAAFGRFYDVTAPRAFAVVLRVVRDRSLAEDVCQEVFVEAWRKATTYDPARGTASTWLLMLAHRRAVDRVRSVQASRDRDRRVATRNLERCADVVWEDVAEGVERDEVRGALRRLSGLQREAIDLTYFQGLTYREAADQLGKPLGTVKSRIRDGLCRLGEQLVADPSRI